MGERMGVSKSAPVATANIAAAMAPSGPPTAPPAAALSKISGAPKTPAALPANPPSPTPPRVPAALLYLPADLQERLRAVGKEQQGKAKQRMTKS